MKHCQAAVAPAAQTAEDARRKKNREAARLCRLKKKQRQQRLKEAFQSLTERNRHLSTIAEKLGRLTRRAWRTMPARAPSSPT
ncbi:hypothetical protein BOX15_Mlig013995g2 [Macrostomum lignano]|uniref:BZIP domain-containing protein n=1 Tax=Macrostomum lignano TaxID=282301 RepID=A0A267ECJ7_9PLAT|nr:hypothetical protein BOX15_Mlig013995g2 [Macrostomum lignano]